MEGRAGAPQPDLAPAPAFLGASSSPPQGSVTLHRGKGFPGTQALGDSLPSQVRLGCSLVVGTSPHPPFHP